MNGIINVLKPPGMTSSNVVVFIRRLLNVKKVGHSGTLDPEAAGVLAVFCGSATRLCEYALADDKEYIGEIHFGCETDTQDAQGVVTGTGDGIISLGQARELFSAMLGSISQIPPKYSALKKDGKKLYEYARFGQEVDIKPRQVFIHSAEILQQTAENRFLFKVSCSKGTYIRTLCHDIGRASGATAHLSFLLRSRTGGYSIDDSVTLEELRRSAEAGEPQKHLLPMDSAISHMPKVLLHERAGGIVRNGGAVRNAMILSSEAAEGEIARMYLGDEFIGICCCESGGIKVRKLLV